jgi:hypothetical protein
VATNSFEVYSYYVCIPGIYLLLFGITFLPQVVVALSGMRAVKILTWSSSPFDVTAALVQHAKLTPVPLRCMQGMSDLDVGGYPAKPSETQPFAWHAHPSIRKVAFSLWGLVVACAVWAMLATLIWYLAFSKVESSVPWESRSFLPLVSSRALWLEFSLSGGVTVQWWIVSFLAVALVQGPLTLVLHCSELIVNVIRDERQWRCATGRNGLRMTTNPLKSFFADPLVLVFFVAKPVLRESFALASYRCPYKLYRLDVWAFIPFIYHSSRFRGAANRHDRNVYSPGSHFLSKYSFYDILTQLNRSGTCAYRCLYSYVSSLSSHCSDRAVLSRLHTVASRRSPTS